MKIEKTLNMIRNYCDFSDPSAVYILLLLPRKKENPTQLEREKISKRSRYVVSNMDDVKFALEEFYRYAKLYPELVFRIYITVNRRSLMKGMINFQKRLLDFNTNIMNGNAEVWNPIAKLGSEFKSTLAKKESKYDKNWMFDIDIPNDEPEGQRIVNEFGRKLSTITTVKYSGKTKSGFVIIIAPCNPSLIDMPPDTELKRDGYLYIDVLNDEYK
jgi:hypothetical protein